MRSTPTATRVKRLLENRLSYFLLALSLWAAGILSGSLALIVVCCLLVYGLPFVYVAALNHEERKQAETMRAASKKTPTPLRHSFTTAFFNGT